MENTACITNWFSFFISPPQRGICSPTILTLHLTPRNSGDSNRFRSRRDILISTTTHIPHISRSRITTCIVRSNTIPSTMLYTISHPSILSNNRSSGSSSLGCFRHTIIKRRTSATTTIPSCPITMTVSRTCSSSNRCICGICSGSEFWFDSCRRYWS